jgi:hypothetical protein
MNIKEFFRILKKHGRDSHKGHFLGGSHKFPLLPKICDCNTRNEKIGVQRGCIQNNFIYDRTCTKNVSKVYVYIDKCSHFDSAKLGSKNAPNPEVI